MFKAENEKAKSPLENTLLSNLIEWNIAGNSVLTNGTITNRKPHHTKN
jgi:hypothetical protein